MAEYLIQSETLDAIANNIRTFSSVGSEPMTLDQMTSAIENVYDTGYEVGVVEGSVMPDFAQNDPMQPDHILNRTHWAEDPVITTEVTLEETTFEFDEYGTSMTPSINLVEGAECVVTWDGVEYTSICEKMELDGMTAFVIGNLAIGGGEGSEDNGQPFSIAYAVEMDVTSLMTNDLETTSHTVKIVSTITTQEIHKLDNKYIDAEWMATSPLGYETVVDIPETTLTFEGNGPFGDTAVADLELDISNVLPNSIARIVIDGIEYTDIVKGSDDVLYFGNVTPLTVGEFSDGVPYFVSLMGLAENVTVFLLPTAGDHTISLTIDAPVYNKLPAHYLPDNIGGGSSLPEVSTEDNNKSLKVVNGEWSIEQLSYNDLTDKPTLKVSDITDLTVTAEELNYVKNIPSMEDEIVSNALSASLAMPGSLKWDGVIGDRYYVPVGEDDSLLMAYVHVSDEYPEIFLSYGPQLTALSLKEGPYIYACQLEPEILDDGFCSIFNEEKGGGVVIIPTDNYAIDGFLFKKKGVYSMAESLLPSGLDVSIFYTSGLSILGHAFSNDNADKYFEKQGNFVDTITWDGNTEGLENLSGVFYKVSDCVPSLTDVQKGYAITVTKADGTSVSKGVSAEEAASLTENNGVISVGYIYIFTKAFTEEGITYSPGIYFYKESDNYVSSFSINGYAFEDSASVIIKTEHLPEALRFGELPTTTALGSAVVTSPDTITWDGNIDGLEEYDGWYKVSSASPSMEDLLNGFSYLAISNTGETESTTVLPENASAALRLHENGYILIGLIGAIMPKGGVSINGVTYSEGVYLFKTTIGEKTIYTSSLTINGYKGFTTTELVTIDPKYLPEDIGGGGFPIEALDTEMSDSSENPVQNKVIKAYVDSAIEAAIGAAIAASY
jgi:hypothetical protein